MSKITDRVLDAAAQAFFRTADVAGLTPIGDRFVQLNLAGADLRGVSWVPGQKVQLRTKGLTTRTLTPTGWDRDAGRTSVLVYLHDDDHNDDGDRRDGQDGEATLLGRKIRSLEVGQPCQMFGPRSSLDLSRLEAAPILVGDETSFGLALAWRTHRPDDPARHVFEASDPAAAEHVLAHVGIAGAELFPSGGDTAAADELARRVGELVAAHPAAPLVLTGKAQTIRHLRAALKAAGQSRHPVKVKAYWDENRAGLD
jgi:NADPH-dependent ferric siderophore reductase